MRLAAYYSRSPFGFTLLEVLIVLCIVGVLGGMMVASFGSNPATQLQATASVLARDLQYARSLAVSNNDKYKITFDVSANQWVLTHSGSNYALDTLPSSPMRRQADLPTQQTTMLAELPNVGTSVRLHAMWTIATTPQAVTDIEFGPLGNTTRSQPTQVWLACGTGTSARYISVRINPVTGLYWVENYQSTAPVVATSVNGGVTADGTTTTTTGS